MQYRLLYGRPAALVASPRASITTMSPSATSRSTVNRTGPLSAAASGANSFLATSSGPRNVPDSGVDPMIVQTTSGARHSRSGREFPRDSSLYRCRTSSLFPAAPTAALRPHFDGHRNETVTVNSMLVKQLEDYASFSRGPKRGDPHLPRVRKTLPAGSRNARPRRKRPDGR